MNELTEVTRELATAGKELASAYEGFGTQLLWFMVFGVLLGLAIAIIRSKGRE